MTTVKARSLSSASVDHDEDRQFTTTLANGMALLSCFREGDGMLANRDFVARMGLTKANVSRLAFTLVTLGFLRLDTASGHYLLGSPVLSMGYPLLASMHIRQIARPYMLELADELDATVSLGVRDRSQMLYVETNRGAMSGTRLADIGTALPLLGSAMGSAWRPQSRSESGVGSSRSPWPERQLSAHCARLEGHRRQRVRQLGRQAK